LEFLPLQKFMILGLQFYVFSVAIICILGLEKRIHG
jgi:hypothetical protein